MQSVRKILVRFVFFIYFFIRNQFEEAATLYERAIQCTRGEDKLLQYAALLYAIRAQGRALKRLGLNFQVVSHQLVHYRTGWVVPLRLTVIIS